MCSWSHNSERALKLENVFFFLDHAKSKNFLLSFSFMLIGTILDSLIHLKCYIYEKSLFNAMKNVLWYMNWCINEQAV